MQSRTHSLIEVLLNIGTGFLISMVIQHYVVTAVWHTQVNFRGNLEITALFTVVSVIRSYFFRRWFNKWSHK